MNTRGTEEQPDVVSVEVVCTQCDATTVHRLTQVLYDLKSARDKTGAWDGFFTNQILVCPGCDVEDEYRLTPMAGMALALAIAANSLADVLPYGSRVQAGRAQLYDGTVVQRPTQALRHLEKLALTRDDGEAWRRLGNLQERLGLDADAAMTWMRALDDEHEYEAAFSLAMAAHAEHAPVAARFAEVALERYTKPESPSSTIPAHHMVSMLVDVVSETYADGRVLNASWCDGEARSGQRLVRMSAVLLSRVPDWGRLVEFLLSDDLLGVYFSDAEFEEELIGTQLEERLRGMELMPVDVEARPRRPKRQPVSAAERRKKRKAERKARKKSRRRR